jgi:hypothetical protein
VDVEIPGVKVAILLSLVVVGLTGCSFADRVASTPVDGFQHKGYTLSCEDVAREQCVKDANHVVRRLRRHARIRMTWLTIRPDSYEGCWAQIDEHGPGLSCGEGGV